MAGFRTVKTNALVLGDMRLGEADRIVRLYTSDRGRVSAVAKGVRRALSHFGGRLEPFSVVHVLLHPGRSLYTVTGAETLYSMAPMRAALFRIEAGGRLFEAASRLLPEEERNPACYNLLVRSTGRLSLTENAAEAELVATAALAKLLLILGFVPELSCCVICGRRDDLVAFSGREGGAVCAECLGRASTGAVFEERTEEALAAFRLLLERPLARLAAEDASPELVAAVRCMALRLIGEHAV